MSKLTNLTNEIDWAVSTFNNAVAQKEDVNGTKYNRKEEAIKANLAYLYYVKQIYPSGRFPTWAQNQLQVPLKKIEAAGFSFRKRYEFSGRLVRRNNILWYEPRFTRTPPTHRKQRPTIKRPTINSDVLIELMKA
jgi:hypothetical protein